MHIHTQKHTYVLNMAPLLYKFRMDAVFFQCADVGLPKLLLLPLCALCHASFSGMCICFAW